MTNNVSKTLLWVGIYAVAMGFLETAVVVYIRSLYYPEGFAFPLKEISTQIATTELLRELGTLVMLISIGILASKNATVRFAVFIYAFAVWDIFYYIFLYLLLGWPQSLLTWDILFMIPTTWVGPVIAPVINSLMMILLAVIIIVYSKKAPSVKIKTREWLFLIAGSIVVLYAYTEEYSKYMLEKFSLSELMNFATNPEILKYTTTFVPHDFKWFIFISGAALHFVGIAIYYFRIKHLEKLAGIK